MLQANQTVADFEIIRLLGKGGMGEVYEAEQRHPRRRVALKVLAPWLANDDDALQRFWREASVPAQLDHPGIVRIISMGKTDEGIAYYTMHLVRGISLVELIRQGQHAPQPSTIGYAAAAAATPSQKEVTDDKPLLAEPAPPSREESPPLLHDFIRDRYSTLARIGAMAARVLASAHGQGFLHRDVKPSNLMIDQHNHLYLVDFGLTRALDPGANATRTGIVIGTPWYMSPEQANSKPVDPRSDLYSLGVTLYELASGGVGPFAASRDNSQAVLEQVRMGMHLPLRTLAPGIPRPLENIIERCIQLKPKKRYQKAEDLAADLEAFAGHESSPAVSARSKTTRTRIGRPVWASASLVAIVAILAAVLLIRLNTDIVPDKDAPNGPGDRIQTVKPKEDPPTGPGKNAQASKEPADIAPLPEMFRKRILRVPLSLLRPDHEPIWKARLLGDGVYWPQPFQLCLWDKSGGRTLYALDNPGRHWFRFSIDLQQRVLAEEGRGKNHAGIFFGWHTPVQDRESVSRRFFIVQLDEYPHPGFPHGQLNIGTGRLIPGNDLRGAASDWSTSLPEDKGVLALDKSGVWHHLDVEVVDNNVRITVDKGRFQVIDQAWLRRQTFHGDPPDPRGTLGIWVGNGMAYFKNAFVTALPSQENGK